MKIYFVISTAHALHGLAIGDFFGVGSRVALLLLPFRFGVAALGSFLAGSRGFAFALEQLHGRLVLIQEALGAVVGGDEPAVEKLVEIPENVVVLVDAVKSQFESREQILDHGA